MTVRILVGDCRGALRAMPDRSVHCVITSPPYWGLRDYQIEPSVWGGNPACEHAWGDVVVDRSLATKGNVGSTLNGPAAQTLNARFEKRSASCSKCGAWRGAFGLEPDYRMYVEHSVEIFREVRRVLRDDGTLWLNLGDSYATGAGKVGDHPGGGVQGANFARINGAGKQSAAAGAGAMTQQNRMPQAGLKPKDLCGIPWRVAFALQADGWWLRQDIVWAKPNPMPESISDRCTKSHEYLFLLSKSERYFYDKDAISEPITYTGNGMDETGFKSAADFDGKNSDGGVRGHRKTAWKTPDGWDTSKGGGGHGSFHREGREAGHTGYVPKPRKSGNTKRKTAAERGCPTGGGKNQASSVPWEGMTRNKRSVWTVATSPFPEAHFATFPPALIEPCVKAGTSEHGCCARCGAPWKRNTEVEYDTDGRTTNGPRSLERRHEKPGFEVRAIKTSQTTGWEPTCDCAPQTKGGKLTRAVVLDPFGGAGTTALVTDRLGRDAILVELNPEYAAMAERRIKGDGGMFACVSLDATAREAVE